MRRILVVSNIDSTSPFGAFTRPYHLGYHLSSHYDLMHVGIDCYSVKYAGNHSVLSRGLIPFARTVKRALDQHHPHIVYAHETLPSVSSLLACHLASYRPQVYLDFHTLSANEYWARLSVASNKLRELLLFAKTYLSQGALLAASCPLIVADDALIHLIRRWYGRQPRRVHVVGNGVPDDLLSIPIRSGTDPYHALRPATIVAVVAPRTYQFPSNDLSVSMALDVARMLQHQRSLHFVVIGRDPDSCSAPLPPNVSFTGFLPDRSQYIAHVDFADVGLLPFSEQAVAGGARNKALDFLARQVLVVSTHEGLRGLHEFQSGVHLLACGNTVHELVQLLRDSVTDPGSRRSLVTAALSLVRQRHTWQAKAEELSSVFDGGLSSCEQHQP